MTNGDERFSRQVRLAEVGLMGQARLARSTVSICRGPDSADPTAAQIEEAYLRRAGVGRTATQATVPVPFVHAQHFRHSRCCQVASGAWRALEQIKRVLAEQAHDTTR